MSRAWSIEAFGLDHLRMSERPAATLGPLDVLVDVRAISLNYRDLMVVTGKYNPKLPLPATPVSDGAGVVRAVGPRVTRWRVGDRVVSHFVADWIDGPFHSEYPRSSLGTPGPGLAAELVVLPEHALVRIPDSYDFFQAATLPIAALTAWSSLVREGRVQPGQTVLTLGTGGVSIFAVQFAKALGARVLITSSSDEKLARARALGADHGINYRSTSDWDKEVMRLTDGRGADVVVETGGAATLNQSMRAARAGGRVAVLGALTGLQSEISTALILMKRLTLCGIYVDCRAAFEEMNEFLSRHDIRPVIDIRLPLEQLPEALRRLERGEHLGKVVLDCGRPT